MKAKPSWEATPEELARALLRPAPGKGDQKEGPGIPRSPGGAGIQSLTGSPARYESRPWSISGAHHIPTPETGFHPRFRTPTKNQGEQAMTPRTRTFRISSAILALVFNFGLAAPTFVEAQDHPEFPDTTRITVTNYGGDVPGLEWHLDGH